MSRREIVLLVSRAIAAFTTIQAVMSLLVQLRIMVLVIFQIRRFPGMNQGFESIFEFARILLLFLIAAMFWRCGPMIEQLLLPTGTQQKSDTPQ
jgi:hypothetical protein